MFDPTKPVQTRDGRAARIICTDRVNDPWSIVALVSAYDGQECILRLTSNGRIFNRPHSDPHDLVNIPEEKTVWVTVYSRKNLGSIGYVFDTEDNARQGSTCANGEISPHVEGIFPVTYKEGGGL